MSPVISIVKCPRCRHAVYAAEQVLACGKKWHKLCFNCGLCNKQLNSGSVCEHDGDIFCRQCYGRLFGIKGVGFGTGAGTLSMDTVENMNNPMSTDQVQNPNSQFVPVAPTYTRQPEVTSTARRAPIGPTASLYSRPINPTYQQQQQQSIPIYRGSDDQHEYAIPSFSTAQRPIPPQQNEYQMFNNQYEPRRSITSTRQSRNNSTVITSASVQSNPHQSSF